MSARFRYRKAALAADYVRGAAGIAFTAGPLAFLAPALGPALALGAAAALFLLYFARAVLRHLSHIELDETGIRSVGPLGRTIRWRELRSVRLGHYTTRSDRSGGWMELVVRGARQGIRVDSGLEGFAQIVRAAAAAARRGGLRLDAATLANLESLGIAPARND